MIERTSRWPHNRRLQIPRYRLVGAICDNCGTKQFPARIGCLECGFKGKLFESKDETTSGVITIQHIPMPVEQVQG